MMLQGVPPPDAVLIRLRRPVGLKGPRKRLKAGDVVGAHPQRGGRMRLAGRFRALEAHEWEPAESFKEADYAKLLRQGGSRDA